MDAATLLADLQRPWRHGEHVDARGIVLDDPLVLDGLAVRGFDLSGARLNGGVSARNTRFLGLAWLRDVEVRGVCDLTGAQFRIDLRGDGLVADELAMVGSTVLGVLSLAGARLQSLLLRDALVMANLTMESAEVGTADLTGAEVLGGLWTARARIGSLKRSEAEISGRVQLAELA